MTKNPAAVLLGVLDGGIILTKRAAGLRSFTGHVCLPGGGVELQDNGFVDTAIREFKEEVYFSGQVKPILCMFPEASVVSQQKVYPVVAELSGQLAGFNPDEVQKLFFLPLTDLSPENFIINPVYPQIRHNKCLNYDGELIWGLTAHILYEFSKSYRNYF